jgi:hypothetical protein
MKARADLYAAQARDPLYGPNGPDHVPTEAVIAKYRERADTLVQQVKLQYLYLSDQLEAQLA